MFATNLDTEVSKLVFVQTTFQQTMYTNRSWYSIQGSRKLEVCYHSEEELCEIFTKQA